MTTQEVTRQENAQIRPYLGSKIDLCSVRTNTGDSGVPTLIVDHSGGQARFGVGVNDDFYAAIQGALRIASAAAEYAANLAEYLDHIERIGPLHQNPSALKVHPTWCDPARCGVVTIGNNLQGLHRSTAVRSEYDPNTGSSVEISLFSGLAERIYLQLEFPGTLRAGIELTPSQGRNLADLISNLLRLVERR